MTKHSRAWHRMHDAALAERQEVAALHMSAFVVLSDADREALKRCGTGRIMELQPGERIALAPDFTITESPFAPDRHARRVARSAYGHQTGSYDD